MAGRTRIGRGETQARVELAWIMNDRQREVPFVIGVLADLSGRRHDEGMAPLTERRFVTVDRDDVEALLRRLFPRVTFEVPDLLGDTGNEPLAVDLTFESFEDFGPEAVAGRVAPMAERLATRSHLLRLMRQARRSGPLDELLSELTRNESARDALGAELETDEPGALLNRLLEAAPDAGNKRDAQADVHAFLRELTRRPEFTSKRVDDELERRVAEIDRAVGQQLDAVLHHPEFQALEASWLALRRFVRNVETDRMLRVRVLDVTREQLTSDVCGTDKLEDTALHRLLLGPDGVDGGEPFGVLLADHDWGQAAGDAHALSRLASLAACAHAPLATALAPATFGLTSFAGLAELDSPEAALAAHTTEAWQHLREEASSRWLCLLLPRVQARKKHGPGGRSVSSFEYDEGAAETGDWSCRSRAVWVFGERIADAFARTGWFASLHTLDGARVEQLPLVTTRDTDGNTQIVSPTEVTLSDRAAASLVALGLTPLVWERGTDRAAFHRPAGHAPREVGDPQLPTSIPFLLIAGRFAHALRMAAADLGTLDPGDAQAVLSGWLSHWVGKGGSDWDRVHQPLAAARLTLRPVADQPEHFEAEVFLRPRLGMQLEQDWRIVVPLPSVVR